MNTELSSLAVRYRRLVARLRDIVQCIVCLEAVGSPAVQCEAGHLMCGQCRDNLEENTCPTCQQPLIAVRNLAVEQVVEALPVKCRNADHGCQEMLNGDEMDTHLVTCPFRQFSCLHPPCIWFGYKPEILAHVHDTHPQQVLSSNKQTVKVPAICDEVSSWTMFIDNEILVLKFVLDRATNFLLGSFECLGQLKPVEIISYRMTVKRGDRETTLSGNIAPERRSASDRQSIGEWNSVFPLSSYDDHPESEASTSRCIKVDVAIEDNRTQASANVEVQTQVIDDVEVGRGDTTRQIDGGNQSDETADHVIHKLGSWLAFGICDTQLDITYLESLQRAITDTKTNIITELVKSIKNIKSSINRNVGNIFYLEMYLYRLSCELIEMNIKMKDVRAGDGMHFRETWMLPFLLIVEQVVYQTFFNYVRYLPALDNVELEKCLTARERQMRDECTLRILRFGHTQNKELGVKHIIDTMGRALKKTEQEISSLQSDAATIPWSNITLS